MLIIIIKKNKKNKKIYFLHHHFLKCHKQISINKIQYFNNNNKICNYLKIFYNVKKII
jgi:hypothetical protein